MALQPSNKSIPLFGGIDTKMDPKYVDPNKSLTAQNVQYFGINRVRKRFGQTQLSNAIANSNANIVTGKAIGSFGNELLVYDGSVVYSYGQTQQNWISRGALTEVNVMRTPIVRTSGSVSGIASLIATGAEIYAWEDSRGGVYYCVRDATSGTMLVPNTLVATSGSSPKIVASGGFVYILYASNNFIYTGILTSNNITAGIERTQLLVTNFVAGSGYSVVSTPTQILLIWAISGGNWGSTIYNGATLSITVTTTFAENTEAQTALAYSTDNSAAIFAIVHPTNIRIMNINVTTAAGVIGSLITAVATHVGVVGTNATTFRLMWDTGTGTTIPAIHAVNVVFNAAVNQATIVNAFGLALAAQPVLQNGFVYAIGSSPLTNLAGNTAQQPAFYLIDGSGNILQRFSSENAFVGGTVIPQLQAISTNQLFVGLAERTQLRADANGTIYTVAGLTNTYFTFPTVSNVQIMQFGNTALISCGNTYTYDGSNIVESGFWDFPDGISTVVAPGGSLNSGIYIYVITYEWQDAAGNIHYSETSYPIQVGTLAAPIALNSQVTLTIPYTVLTRKVGVTVNIYRTATAPNSPATLDTALGPWFKITSQPNLTDGTASFTYVDRATDASIQGQQFLYSPPDGTGELENFAPPPFAFMVATKTRVFGLAQDNPTTLWYSKPLNPGRPTEFSLFQTLQVESAGGAVTALSSLDTQAIIFKTKRIYFLPGDGPNSQGGGVFFGSPQLISSTSGCISQPSILSTHNGVFFKGELGLQQLQRSFMMETTVGLPVQGFNFLAITGAHSASAQNQLRWTSSNGTALIYDYVTNRWCTYSGYDAVGYASWNGTFARLRADGTVWIEDQANLLDGTAPIPMVLETSWLKLADMAQGYAAIWYAMVLGEYRDSHTLTVEIAYDYTDVPAQTVVFTPAGNINTSTFGSDVTFGSGLTFGGNALSPSTNYQPRIALIRQTCEVVKFKIYDTNITGASCDLYEIALQLGVIGGINRVTVSRQVP